MVDAVVYLCGGWMIADVSFLEVGPGPKPARPKPRDFTETMVSVSRPWFRLRSETTYFYVCTTM